MKTGMATQTHVEARPLDLRLRHVFRVSRGGSDVKRNVLVERREDGRTGLGEAAPIRRYEQDYDSAAAAVGLMAERVTGSRLYASAARESCLWVMALSSATETCPATAFISSRWSWVKMSSGFALLTSA